MTETTATEPAQPQRVQIDPIAMANEARAMRDFLETHSLQNANNAVLLFKKVKELEATLEEQAKVHKDELDRITGERDQMVQRLGAANAKIIEIQNSQSVAVVPAKSKVKANG